VIGVAHRGSDASVDTIELWHGGEMRLRRIGFEQTLS
jgi:hypothetical protein